MKDINKMDVLLVAARKEYLQTYLDLIIDAGLKPVLVDGRFNGDLQRL